MKDDIWLQWRCTASKISNLNTLNDFPDCTFETPRPQASRVAQKVTNQGNPNGWRRHSTRIDQRYSFRVYATNQVLVSTTIAVQYAGLL